MIRKEEREQFANEQVKGAEKLYGYKYSIKDVECACLSGAEWADRTMIDKACEWLESVNLDYYQIREGVFSKELVIDFRKAMEE